MGAWSFVSTFIEEIAEDLGFKDPRPRYAGRTSAASPATGSNQLHRKQQAALIEDALTLGKKHVSRIAARKALHGKTDLSGRVVNKGSTKQRAS